MPPVRDKGGSEKAERWMDGEAQSDVAANRRLLPLLIQHGDGSLLNAVRAASFEVIG